MQTPLLSLKNLPEDQMLPKMRKHWIHNMFEAYQRMKADAGEDDDMGIDGAWLYFCTSFLVLIDK
jgi:hypothetical protein